MTVSNVTLHSVRKHTLTDFNGNPVEIDSGQTLSANLDFTNRVIAVLIHTGILVSDGIGANDQIILDAVNKIRTDQGIGTGGGSADLTALQASIDAKTTLSEAQASFAATLATHEAGDATDAELAAAVTALEASISELETEQMTGFAAAQAALAAHEAGDATDQELADAIAALETDIATADQTLMDSISLNTAAIAALPTIQNLTKEQVEDNASTAYGLVSGERLSQAVKAHDVEAANSSALSGTVDTDTLLAGLAIGQAYHFQTIFGEVTIQSNGDIGAVVNGDATGQPANPDSLPNELLVPNSVQGYMARTASGGVSVVYTTGGVSADAPSSNEITPLAKGVEAEAFPDWTDGLALTTTSQPLELGVDLSKVDFLDFSFTRNDLQHVTGRLALADFLYDEAAGALLHWWDATGIRVRIDTDDVSTGRIFVHYLTANLEIQRISFRKRIDVVPTFEEFSITDGDIVHGAWSDNPLPISNLTSDTLKGSYLLLRWEAGGLHHWQRFELPFTASVQQVGHVHRNSPAWTIRARVVESVGLDILQVAQSSTSATGGGSVLTAINYYPPTSGGVGAGSNPAPESLDNLQIQAFSGSGEQALGTVTSTDSHANSSENLFLDTARIALTSAGWNNVTRESTITDGITVGTNFVTVTKTGRYHIDATVSMSTTNGRAIQVVKNGTEIIGIGTGYATTASSTPRRVSVYADLTAGDTIDFRIASQGTPTPNYFNVNIQMQQIPSLTVAQVIDIKTVPVDNSGVDDGDLLRWNATAEQYEPVALPPPHLPIDAGIVYIDTTNGDLSTITEYANGVTSFWNRQDAAGVFTAFAAIPANLIVKPAHFPSLAPDTDGNVLVDFFQDATGFTLNYRGASGANKRYELWLESVAYETIPNLTLPTGVTYETGPNPSGGFNHLFIGEISGFANVSISGDAPVPAGDNTAPQIFGEVF